MIQSKLPRRLAVAGLAVSFSLMAMWWYITTYDPFHLPTAEQVVAMPEKYSTPPLYEFLENLTLVLCPGSWLSNLTVHAGTLANVVVWIIAALLDALILYGVGIIINAIQARLQGEAHP